MDSFSNKSNLKAGRKYGNDISSVGDEFTLSANIHFPHEYMNPFSPSYTIGGVYRRDYRIYIN